MSLLLLHYYHRPSLVPGACENRGAPGTHCLHMHLISPRCGESGLFSDSSMLCDVRARTRYSILVRIIKWRVMKVQIFSKRFLMPFSDLRPQVWFSRWSKEPSLNFQLFPCTSHTRFAKPSSSFNVISYRAFILDASLSWLAFYGGYKQTYQG